MCARLGWRLERQRLHARETLPRGIAGAKMRVGFRQIRMRIGRPGLLDDPAGAAQFAGFAEQPPGQLGGGNKRRRELQGVERERTGAVAFAVGRRERASGQQHGALALVFGLVDQAVAAVAVERRQRRRPVAGRAAEFQHRLPGPAERGRGVRRLLGIGARRGHVLPPLRLDIKPAQPEQLGVVALRHGAERMLGGGAIAGELRELRVEQKRQRLARRDPLGFVAARLAAAASPAPTATSPREIAR